VDQRYEERHRATSAGFAADYAAHFLYGGTLVSIEDEYDLYQRIVPGITLRMVNAVAEDWMRIDNRVILINMPVSDSVRPPRESRLRALIHSVDAARTAPYVDSLSAAPLLGISPLPGSIVTERSYQAIGVTEWTLGNGARVLLKPTDFRDDEVLFVARSPGGSSLLPDADYRAAITATAVVQAGGLGELSQVELRKRLAGTIAGIGADISEVHEGLSGAASARDLETLFQLIHLKFTSPRLDTAAIEAYRQQARATLALRAAAPEQAFVDTLRTILSQGHPRARPPTAELFNRLDIDRSFAIYADRFADASDFTFYLVGAFSLDSMRPLVLRYLASLPSVGRLERGRDVGIRSPDGVVRATVRRGREPRARTQIVFAGPIELDRNIVYELDALAGVLRIRLRESLREDLSGTYGVDVRAGAAGEPRPRYQLSIAFGADPERVTELTGVVFEVIDSLRAVGPTAGDLAKVKEMELRERQTDLRTNRFWIEAMLSYDQQGWPLTAILDYPAWLAGLDAEVVRRAAIRYTDPATHVQVTLLPASGVGELGGSAGIDREGVANPELP
jgi:zinc protease